jgi:hypothetical protein
VAEHIMQLAQTVGALPLASPAAAAS